METENEYKDQVYETLNLKETSELLEIWKTNNRKAWTDAAFLTIEKILKDRSESLPPQEAEGKTEEVMPVEDDKISSRLVWVSSLADVLSYIALILFVFQIVATLASLNGGISNIISYVIVVVTNLLIGGILFVILQLISKSILVLLEIRDNIALMAEGKQDSK